MGRQDDRRPSRSCEYCNEPAEATADTMVLSERFNGFVKDPMLSAAHVRRKATAGSIGAPGEANLRSLHWRVRCSDVHT